MKKLGWLFFVLVFSFTLTSGEGYKKDISRESSKCPYLNSVQKSESKLECPYLKAKKKSVEENNKSECPYLEKQKLMRTKKDVNPVLEVKMS